MLNQNFIFLNFMINFSLLKFKVCARVLVILQGHNPKVKKGTTLKVKRLRNTSLTKDGILTGIRNWNKSLLIKHL